MIQAFGRSCNLKLETNGVTLKFIYSPYTYAPDSGRYLSVRGHALHILSCHVVLAHPKSRESLLPHVEAEVSRQGQGKQGSIIAH